MTAAAPVTAQVTRTPPSVPRNVQVVAGDGKLTLTWQAPTSWGSFTAQQYEIGWRIGSDPWSPLERLNTGRVNPATSATSYVVTGTYSYGSSTTRTIENGTTYDLRIRAASVNPGDSGDTLPSNWVTVSGTPEQYRPTRPVSTNPTDHCTNGLGTVTVAPHSQSGSAVNNTLAVHWTGEAARYVLYFPKNAGFDAHSFPDGETNIGNMWFTQDRKPVTASSSAPYVIRNLNPIEYKVFVLCGTAGQNLIHNGATRIIPMRGVNGVEGSATPTGSTLAARRFLVSDQPNPERSLHAVESDSVSVPFVLTKEADEGSSTSYRLRLGGRPSRDVTVTPRVADSSQAGLVTFSPTSFTFTTSKYGSDGHIVNGNWFTYPEITVTTGTVDTDTNVEIVHDLASDDPSYNTAQLEHGAHMGARRNLLFIRIKNICTTCSTSTNQAFIPVAISASPDVTEGGTATFTVTVPVALTSDLDVPVTVSQSGNFVRKRGRWVTRRRDGKRVYQWLIGKHTVTIPAGQKTATLTIPTTDDTTDEPDGSVTATLAAGTGYVVADTGGSATVTVKDDDGPPEVSITADDLRVGESVWAATFTVTVPVALRSDLDVTVNVSQSGDFAETSALGARTVTIPRGSTTARLRVRLVNDETDEPNGSVTATLAAGTGYVVADTGGSATVTVIDNDDPPQAAAQQQAATPNNTVLIAGGPGVTEGGNATFSVTVNPRRFGALGLEVDVTVSQSGNFAETSVIGTRKVTIPAYKSTATFTVPTVDDETFESDGSITATPTAIYATYRNSRILRLETAYTYTLTGGKVAVADNDDAPQEAAPPAPPEVSIAAGPGVTEGAGAAFTVTADSAPASDLKVSVNVWQSGDFIAELPFDVTIPAGETTATLTVATLDDETDEPDGSVSAEIAAGTGYAVAATSGTATVAVADNDEPPLTAAFQRVPSEHDGKGAFWFNLNLSEALGEGGTVPTAASFAVDGGKVKRVGQIEPGLWRVRVQPKNWKDVQITLTGGRACSEEGAVCTSDGRALSNTSTATIGGPVRIRVKGGKAREGRDATLAFKVTLNRAAAHVVQVDHATADGTATAGADYTPMAGTVIFAPGVTTQTVEVPILDDAIDEGKETFKLKLSNPQGAYLRKRHAEAVGVIRNDDPLPAAWHVRFGRTVSQQVVDALQGRFAAKPQAGLQMTVAGEDLTTDTPLAENQQVLAKLMGFESVSGQQLVQESSFSFSPSGSGPQLSFWGQGALSSFQGREENLSLDGDVTTALLGAEWRAERWQAGAALSHSWGNGGYKGGDGAEGEISTNLTGIFPYGRYALTPRLGIWATAGYGWGNLTLTRETEEHKPNTNLTMAAGGMDGLLVDGGPDGLSLTTRADAMTVKTTTDQVSGLASSDANVSRFRLGLEAARPFPMANGASFLPTMTIGIRQDNGDAETGFGMDLGAGISYADPQRGISAELKGRTLLTHAAEGFQDKGMTASFSWDPTPSNRGPSLSMSHSLGAAADGGLDALLNPDVLQALDEPTSNGRQQFETRLAYGFPAFNDRLTLTPALGMAFSQDSTTYRLLWALAPYADQQGQVDEPWELSLEGERQEGSNNSSPVDHALKLRFSLSL